MQVGFIGLGNVGCKLSGSLIRNGWEVLVLDLDADLVAEKTAAGVGLVKGKHAPALFSLRTV